MNLAIARRYSILLCVCVGLTGCKKDVATLTAGPLADGGLQNLEVSSGDLVSAFDPTADHFEVASLNTSGSVKIRVTTGGGTVNLGGNDIPAGQWVSLPLKQLDKTATVPMTVDDGAGHVRAYQISSLPKDFPDYTVTANSPVAGTILMAANTPDLSAPSYLFELDQNGHPTYYKRLSDLGYTFQRYKAPDGTLRYTYLQREGDQIPSVSGAQGSVRLLDANFQELQRIRILPHGDHGVLNADMHEFVYFDDQHYIAIGMEPKSVTNIPSQPGVSSKVAAAIIQEVQNGQVVFEWDSSQFPEFYANSSDGNDYANSSTTYADYMHMNSVQVDPSDNNLIVSFRHQDQVCKLDRKTGQIVWRLGGKDSDFALGDEQKFSHQHFARIDSSGTLTFFDNGNATQRTRLLTFKLDQPNRRVTDFNSFEPETRFSGAMGSFQLLGNDAAFIGWGYKVSGTSDAEEYDGDGNQTFSWSFSNPKYESYRALKYVD